MFEIVFVYFKDDFIFIGEVVGVEISYFSCCGGVCCSVEWLAQGDWLDECVVV